MLFLAFLAVFSPTITIIVVFLRLRETVGEKVAAMLLGGNILAFIYLLLFHTSLGPRLLTQEAYWIGAFEEFVTTPVLIICSAVRSRCFQKLLQVYLNPSFEEWKDEERQASLNGWKKRLMESDFTCATGLVLLFIITNIFLLGGLARASF